MFNCSQCGSAAFELEGVSPLLQIKVSLTQAHEVVITPDGHAPFIADTKFMNTYARCQQCGATHCWQQA